MQQQTNWGIFKLILWAVIQLGTFKMFWNEGKEKMEIPERMGGLHKPLWNGNSEGMGGLKRKIFHGEVMYILWKYTLWLCYNSGVTLTSSSSSDS